MILRETGIEGDPVSYPFEIEYIKDSLIAFKTINNETELIEHFEPFLERTTNIKEALKHSGLERLNFLDSRTVQMIKAYQYFKNNPDGFDKSSVWFESFIIIDSLLGFKI